MENIVYKLDFWELDEEGDIVFQSTEVAYLYAILIFNDLPSVQKIRELKKKYLNKFLALRKDVSVDVDEMFQLSRRHQFYRECLEEVERLDRSRYSLNDLA